MAVADADRRGIQQLARYRGSHRTPMLMMGSTSHHAVHRKEAVLLSVHDLITAVRAHVLPEEHVEDIPCLEETEGDPSPADYGVILALLGVAAICAFTGPGIAFVARLGQVTNAL